MANIPVNVMRTWKNGETIEALQYNKEREVLVIANNDNYVKVMEALNQTTSLQSQFDVAIVNGDSSLEAAQGRVSVENLVYGTIKQRLDAEYMAWQNEFDFRDVNPVKFGADPTGTTSSDEAFDMALEGGHVNLILPPGVFRYSGLKLPSYVRIKGAGKGRTKLILSDDAPVGASNITNDNHAEGNKYIWIEDLTLDWNKGRIADGKTIPKGPTSSNVLLANVQWAWVKNVEGLNGGLHCFDVTSPNYNRPSEINDPTYYQPGGCQYVWVENCYATNAGDDNFTTHFSNYIWFRKCISVDPGGSAGGDDGESNTNCFEIDDGSRNVWVEGCYAKGGVRGFEVKAHAYAPAARNVHLLNCVAENNVRAFDLRHIGNHVLSDPISASAFDVSMIGCKAINPIVNEKYTGLTPRALTVSAYRNVNISDFTAIGGEDGLTASDVVVVLQYKSGYININGIKISGFKNAGTDINLTGGDNRAHNVNLSNVVIWNSALKGIFAGSGMDSYNIMGVSMLSDGRAGSVGVELTETGGNILGLNIDGYETKAKVSGLTYERPIARIRDGLVVASSTGAALHDTSFIFASTTSPKVTVSKGFIGGSSGGEVTGEWSFLLGTAGNSKAAGFRTSVISSTNSQTAEGIYEAEVHASNGVINRTSNTMVGGWGSGEASSSNIKWELNSRTGTAKATGSFTGASTFQDFGEYMESESGLIIPSAYIVSEYQSKIHLAQEGEWMVGVISETAGIMLGESTFVWQGQYLKNMFGGTLTKTVYTEDGAVEEPVLNPDFVSTQEYVSREKRPEWHKVGMVGQVYVRTDETVTAELLEQHKEAGVFVAPNNGIATASLDRGQGWKIMKVTTPYSEELGFGVALCLIK